MLYQATRLGRTHGHGEAAVRALDGVSFAIAAGETVAVVGPSGCGKTTLLSILGLIDGDFDGELVLGGVATRALSRQASARLRLQRIGFVFQAFHLVPTLSVIDNVALPHWHLHGGAAPARRAARALLAEVGLEQRAKADPRKLSGGELQRVALARALINRPDVVLADEPTGNLDSENQARVLDLLCAVPARGAALVVVTHNSAVAAIARRTLLLRDGRLVSDLPAP